MSCQPTFTPPFVVRRAKHRYPKLKPGLRLKANRGRVYCCLDVFGSHPGGSTHNRCVEIINSKLAQFLAHLLKRPRLQLNYRSRRAVTGIRNLLDCKTLSTVQAVQNSEAEIDRIFRHKNSGRYRRNQQYRPCALKSVFGKETAVQANGDPFDFRRWFY